VEGSVGLLLSEGSKTPPLVKTHGFWYGARRVDIVLG